MNFSKQTPSSGSRKADYVPPEVVVVDIAVEYGYGNSNGSGTPLPPGAFDFFAISDESQNTTTFTQAEGWTSSFSD